MCSNVMSKLPLHNFSGTLFLTSQGKLSNAKGQENTVKPILRDHPREGHKLAA